MASSLFVVPISPMASSDVRDWITSMPARSSSWVVMARSASCSMATRINPPASLSVSLDRPRPLPSAASGIVKPNDEPTPSSLVAWTLPPIISARWRTM